MSSSTWIISQVETILESTWVRLGFEDFVVQPGK